MSRERLTTFRRGRLEFDVVDRGPLDGDPVVLLHGFPERASSWEAVQTLLGAEGMRTYALDQRGYSPGARPFGRWSYRFPDLVDDVVALIAEIGRPVHLVGHDWGAMVAWGLADRRPDLVRSLSAVSVPHPKAMVHASVQGPQAMRSWYFVPFSLPGLVEGVVRFTPALFDATLRRTGMRPEDIERFHAEIVDDGALSGGLAWYRGGLLSLPRAGVIRVPTTYVWSDGDTALSWAAAQACGRYVEADYELVVLEQVSHWIPRHAPDELSHAVLARIRSTA